MRNENISLWHTNSNSYNPVTPLALLHWSRHPEKENLVKLNESNNRQNVLGGNDRNRGTTDTRQVAVKS